MTKPEPNYPESFQNLLIGPDLGAVGGGGRRGQRKARTAWGGGDSGS